MSTNDAGSKEIAISPSVSPEKWRQHALRKLGQGYVLIIGKNRRNANFYKAGKGFEPCAFAAASKLAEQALLEEAGRHPLGTVYKLTSNAPTKIAEAPKPAPDWDDDDDETPEAERELGWIDKSDDSSDDDLDDEDIDDLLENDDDD